MERGTRVLHTVGLSEGMEEAISADAHRRHCGGAWGRLEVRAFLLAARRREREGVRAVT